MRHDEIGRRGLLAVAGAGAVLAMGASGPRAQGGGEPTQIERRYARETLEIGRFLLETSRAATETMGDEALGEFARREVAEQEAMRAILTSMGVEVPQLEPQHENGLAAIRQGGGEMSPDLLYVNTQILGHGSLLKAQQVMGAREPITMAVATAKLAEEATKSHLAALGDHKIRLTSG